MGGFCDASNPATYILVCCRDRDRLIETLWRTLMFYLKPAFVVYSTRVDTSKLNTLSHVTICDAMLIQVTSSTCTACGTASEPKPCYRFEKFSMTISRITENGVLVKMEDRAKNFGFLAASGFLDRARTFSISREDLLSKR